MYLLQTVEQRTRDTRAIDKVSRQCCVGTLLLDLMPDKMAGNVLFTWAGWHLALEPICWLIHFCRQYCGSQLLWQQRHCTGS